MEASRNSALRQANSFEARCKLEQQTYDCFARTSHPYEAETSRQLDAVGEKCKQKLHGHSRSSPSPGDSYRVKQDRLIVPLSIIDETLKEQGYQYGQGKNFPQQIQTGYLDCELSTLAYLLTLNRLKEQAMTPQNYSLTSMHDEEQGSHVCIRASLEDEPILWETSIGSSARVEQEEYQAKFPTIRHHPHRETTNLPVSIVASHLADTDDNESLFAWLDQLLMSPNVYPSPDFYSSTILSLVNKSEADIAALHKLHEVQRRIIESSNSSECLFNKATVAMHIATHYQETNQDKDALEFYQLALKDIQRARNLSTTPYLTFALSHCSMNIFLLTGDQVYRDQAIHNFKQVLDLPNFTRAATESLLELDPYIRPSGGT